MQCIGGTQRFVRGGDMYEIDVSLINKATGFDNNDLGTFLTLSEFTTAVAECATNEGKVSLPATYADLVTTQRLHDDSDADFYDAKLMPVEIADRGGEMVEFVPTDDDTIMGGIKNLLPSSEKRKSSSLQRQ